MRRHIVNVEDACQRAFDKTILPVGGINFVLSSRSLQMKRCQPVVISFISLMVAILLTAPQLIIASVPVVGSPWSGNMHPQIGFPPACDISTPNSCAPSYADLDSARQLWPCPRGDATSDTCGGDGRCVIGEGAVCNNLSGVSPCCCPRVGCRCKHVKGCVSALAFLLRVFSMS